MMKPANKPATSPDSLFPDHYDIEAEKAALNDLLVADNPDTTDPRWPRVVELENRIRALSQIRHAYTHRSGAETVVSNREAMDMNNIGTLVDEDQDSMTLHTREAFRLFVGRSRDVDGQYGPIVGGKRVASALRSAWALSANDNPYADWVLVSFMDEMDVIRKELEDSIAGYDGLIGELRARGLNYSILKSRKPVNVDLGFRSPYGYAVAELIVQYDYVVRQIKTLVRKDRITDADGRILLRQRVRGIRAMFELPPRYERYLMREELRQMSRSDWMPEAGIESGKRVAAVVGLFGEVPREVFTGAVRPRHSQRRANLSEQELRLLQDVALSPVVVTGDAEADEDELM
jgi:integrating conjugative element protein (TIGR03761 family)